MQREKKTRNDGVRAEGKPEAEEGKRKREAKEAGGAYREPGKGGKEFPDQEAESEKEDGRAEVGPTSGGGRSKRGREAVRQKAHTVEPEEGRFRGESLLPSIEGRKFKESEVGSFAKRGEERHDAEEEEREEKADADFAFPVSAEGVGRPSGDEPEGEQDRGADDGEFRVSEGEESDGSGSEEGGGGGGGASEAEERKEYDGEDRHGADDDEVFDGRDADEEAGGEGVEEGSGGGGARRETPAEGAEVGRERSDGDAGGEGELASEGRPEERSPEEEPEVGGHESPRRGEGSAAEERRRPPRPCAHREKSVPEVLRFGVVRQEFLVGVAGGKQNGSGGGEDAGKKQEDC